MDIPSDINIKASKSQPSKSEASKSEPKQLIYYIIQKLNKTYLTLKKNGDIVFESLNEQDKDSQKWYLYRSDILSKKYESIGFKNINEIVPYTQTDYSLCLDENTQSLMLKIHTTKSQCIFWDMGVNKDIDDYRVHNNNTYANQYLITNVKFAGKVNLYDSFIDDIDDDIDDDKLEAKYLTVQTFPEIGPILTITSPIISYDFDGVLHLSIKPDPEFHIKLERATYHPLNFMTSDLLPFTELIEQLIDDYNQGNQIIIVTARPLSSDKYVKKYLSDQKILDMVDKVLYIAKKTPFLLAVKAIKHYDDSPKQIIPLLKAGIPVFQVDPPLNRFWINKND